MNTTFISRECDFCVVLMYFYENGTIFFHSDIVNVVQESSFVSLRNCEELSFVSRVSELG